jgi:hypothetical protein
MVGETEKNPNEWGHDLLLTLGVLGIFASDRMSESKSKHVNLGVESTLITIMSLHLFMCVSRF